MTRLSLARSLTPAAPPHLPALPEFVRRRWRRRGGRGIGRGGGLGFDGRRRRKERGLERISTFPRPRRRRRSRQPSHDGLLVFGRWSDHNVRVRLSLRPSFHAQPRPFLLACMYGMELKHISKTAVYFRRSTSFHSHSIMFARLP